MTNENCFDSLPCEPYEEVEASSAKGNPLYAGMKALVKLSGLRSMMAKPREEVLAAAAKKNAKNRHFRMPRDTKARYQDHIVTEGYHCLEIGMASVRRDKAVLFVFGGGMILGSDAGDISLSREIAKETGSDIWFPYYPLCLAHDIMENIRMVFACYQEMLQYYSPEKIVFLGFSSGGALILDLITYINEENDKGQKIPMPGLLIPISPGSIPVTEEEKERLHRLSKTDVLIPEEYMYTAKEIMEHGNVIPIQYLATAHGDFRNAPMTHFYYGSDESLYAFAPTYAASYRKAGAKCLIHVGKGMHHCYPMQPFVPGCRGAYREVLGWIRTGACGGEEN